MAEREEILIMRHGKPAGLLIGFSSEDWIEYRLENHPELLGRIAKARRDLEAGLGTRLEEFGDWLKSSRPTRR
jgi:PHD/YefM family antitoxin component YafN of YafNO toxin-antitoxin module